MADKVKYTSQYIDNMSFDDSLGVSMVEIIGADGVLQNLAGMNIPAHDSITATYDDPNFKETYVYASGATTVATVVVIYTDATKAKLVSVTKT